MQAMVEKVTNTVVGALKGTGEIANAVTQTASGAIVTALKSSGAVGKALTEAVADVASGVGRRGNTTAQQPGRWPAKAHAFSRGSA